ncbi:MAG TPA: hypothetical protein VF468_11770 [Actinomycetota bacterium]|nr:hypothetical protein [Actinomycetota bacterium]
MRRSDQDGGDRLGLLIVAARPTANGSRSGSAPPQGGVTATARLPATVLSARAPDPVRPG